MTTTDTVLAVKPLVWEGDKAQSPIGVYSVTRTPDGYASSFEWEEIAFTGYNAVDASYGARRAAQDHCQADYEQRILSAIALPAGGEVEPVAWACKTCNSPRSIDPCPKCGTPLTKPADGWDWPTLPDIDRIRALAREVGYAVGVHGSLERDLDLIAAPWVAEAVEPMALAEHIAAGLGGRVVDYERQDKPCGRWSCNIHTPDWTKMIDLSVMPPAAPNPAPSGEAVPVAWRVRERPGFDWRLTTGDPERNPRFRDQESQPLYAAPPSPQGVDATDALVKFARWAITESAFSGHDLEGAEVQAEAERLGLIKATVYDPERHGPSDAAEPGMDWYEFTAALSPTGGTTDPAFLPDPSAVQRSRPSGNSRRRRE